MVLPGKAATAYRQKFADIVTRYLAGDASMHAEIRANAASSNPICEMAREALEVGDSQVGEKRAAVEDELTGASEGAGVLVKRLREAADMATGIHPTLASMKASAEDTVVAIQATADAMERIVRLKKECCDIDEHGRAREMLDAGKRAELDMANIARRAELDMANNARRAEFEASVRAREREDIIAKARADAEALAIVAEAKRQASAPPAPRVAYQNVAEFLPDDHTTVEMVYSENKCLQVRKRDKTKHLNEAKLEVLRLYRAEFAGATPKKVMCAITNRLVDMYPKSWTGLRGVLVGMIRHKNGGHGQMDISSCFPHNGHICLHLAQ